MDSRSVQTIVPWAALGISVVALVFAVLAWVDRGGGGAAKPTPPPAAPFSPPVGALSFPGNPPDLSTMSPREAADRLFNRVMTASENGNTAEVLQFAPMALQAYKNLGTLDNDARYHVALVHLAAGDVKSARVATDELLKAAPNHLLGIMLEYKLAEKSGNKEAAARAYRKFLAAYDTERAKNLREYQEHQTGIEHFHDVALASTASKK